MFPTTMLLLTETTLFHLDILDQFSAANVGMEKDDYAGIGKTKDWAEKLATSKLLRPSISHSIRTPTHTRVSSITTSTAVSKITHGSLASTNLGPPPTPARSVRESDLSLLDDDDSLEREAAYQASKKSDSARRTTSVSLIFFIYIMLTLTAGCG